jgi:hypothetical protein
MGHGAESIDGLGAHSACVDHAGRILVLAFPQDERRVVAISLLVRAGSQPLEDPAQGFAFHQHTQLRTGTCH